MPRTVEAVVEKDGSLRLLEEVELREGERALVTILSDDVQANDDALLSEPALAAEWEREEEADAWRHLQP
jgi:predicted DNA-binding antitoxin AbrB/MazE fold protein